MPSSSLPIGHCCCSLSCRAGRCCVQLLCSCSRLCLPPPLLDAVRDLRVDVLEGTLQQLLEEADVGLVLHPAYDVHLPAAQRGRELVLLLE